MTPSEPPPLHRLGDEWREFEGALVRDRFLDAGHLHGDQALGMLSHVDGDLLALLSGDPDLRTACLADLRFLDIEATGLGGAGAMVFLVGVGRWADARFQLRQYLAPSPPAEGALLRCLVADCLEDAADPVLVTYNGATYDAPLLDGRGTLHRLRAGFDPAAHLDLLKTVRRGFGDALRPHRLSHIEATLLGVARREDEVAGADVPGWYFRFLRSGDARMLRPVVEHNADDVLSLAAMLGRFAALRVDAIAPTALESLMLGRLHARAERYEEALRYLDVARLGLDSIVSSHIVALEMARLLRRLGRRHEAVILWGEVAAGPVAPTAALVELAKHQEHRLRDFESALHTVERALELSGHSPALLHRRARLQRRATANAPPQCPTVATAVSLTSGGPP
jgi:uncharacterized protein YprB with RNaseH-like and TPR domain